MNKQKNKNFKVLKKIIKKNKKYNEYKKFYIHPKTRFFITHFILYFYKELNIILVEKIIDLEYKFIRKDKKNIKSFIELSILVKKLLPKDQEFQDLKSFFTYFYYVFQTSTYYYDKRHKLNNIYISQNYIKLNSIKRNSYFAWIKSIKKNDPLFNDLILYIKRFGI